MTSASREVPATPETVSPETPALGDIGVAIPKWRGKLLDLVGGSALWDVTALGSAAVDLTGAHPSGVAQLFAGRRTVLSNLVREGSALTTARKHMRAVITRRDELTQLYGVAGTYVAMGVATWAPADEDEEDPSPNPIWKIPVFLRAVYVRPIDGTAEYELELDDEVQVNTVLLEQLAEAGVTVEAEELIASTGKAHGFTPAPAFESLRNQASELNEFDIEPTIVLGTFVHPGQALADDLDAMNARGMNPLVRSLAGEIVDADTLTRPLPAVRLADPEPGYERGVGDMDLSEHRVLDALAGGSSLVVDTPPGVDSAGTVVKIAAWAAAEGKRVAYLPGTRRSAQGVLDAARAIGVEQLFLDLAHNEHWPQEAARQLVDSLNPAQIEVDESQVRKLRQELVEQRERLSSYIRALHTARDPWQTSAYHALQALAELTAKRPGPRTQVQLPANTARELSEQDRASIKTMLQQASDLGAFRLRASDTPWYGAELQGADHANEVLALVQDLHGYFPELTQQVSAASVQTGLDEATTMNQWLEQLGLLEGIASSLDQFLPQIFERSVAPMAAATGSRKWRAENNIDLAWSQRRHLRKQAKDMVRPGVHLSDLHGELLLVAQRRELWRAQCAGGGWPQLPDRMSAMVELAQAMKDGLEQLNPVLAPTLAGQDLLTLPFADLGRRLERLVNDDATLRQMPARADLMAQLRGFGLSPLLDDLSARRVSGELVHAEFELAWWSSVLEEMLREDKALVGLESDGLVATAERVRELDAAHIETLRAPVLNRVRGHITERIASMRSNAQNFYRAVMGGENDLLRLQQWGPIAWQPRPVWIIPPMVVPQVLGPEAAIDIVIIDAAARLPAEHAVPLVARASQAVVLGDHRQVVADSLMAASELWPTVALSADRVDVDESIAAFLSQHGYADSVPIVPTPVATQSLHFVAVEGTGMPGPGKVVVESVQEEVHHVVDLVIEHVLTRPQESLAVVALNPHHAERIREGIHSAVSQSSSMANFINPNQPEAFTVLDVADAGGLRRDAVIISVGFGKTPHGRVLHNFGAISEPQGDGLIINAIQAARSHLSVVSSFGSHELDPQRMRSTGAKVFYDLLVAAEEGAVKADPAESHPDEDRLLLDVAERLWRLGVNVVPQYGWRNGLRIPLAVGHARDQNRLSVAVVIDDHHYVTEPSVRKRERHWIERLERRGWRVCRIYSSAVFLDPQGEAERIKKLVDEVYTFEQQQAQPASHVIVPPPRVSDDFDPEKPVAADVLEEPIAPGSQVQAEESAVQPTYGQLRIDDRGELIVGTTTTSIPRIVVDEARGVRPPITPGMPLSAYGDDELDALAAWVVSDGIKRDTDELMAILQVELGLERSSQHTRSILAAVIKRMRGTRDSNNSDAKGDQPQEKDGLVQDALLDEHEFRGNDEK